MIEELKSEVSNAEMITYQFHLVSKTAGKLRPENSTKDELYGCKPKA
jgi:hypothetical protein